jgi:two-component system KDP operon response regulator KdpE
MRGRAEDKPVTPADSTHSNKKIMVVDDEPDIRMALQVGLRAHGYEVVVAATGEEALEKLSTEKPDVVVLDLDMPGSGGLETCRAIRATLSARIILMSARSSGVEKDEALSAGAADFLGKPFSIDELIARIRETP